MQESIEYYREIISNLKNELMTNSTSKIPTDIFNTLFKSGVNNRDETMFKLGFEIATLRFIKMVLTHLPDKYV